MYFINAKTDSKPLGRYISDKPLLNIRLDFQIPLGILYTHFPMWTEDWFQLATSVLPWEAFLNTDSQGPFPEPVSPGNLCSYFVL